MKVFKKGFKQLTVILTALTVTVFCGTSVCAAETDNIVQPDKIVSVQINTDKTDYSSGEKAEFSYEITKTVLDPSYEIENVTVHVSADPLLEKVGICSSVNRVSELSVYDPVFSTDSTALSVIEEKNINEHNNGKSSIIGLIIVCVILFASIAFAAFFVRSKKAKISFFMSLLIIMGIAVPNAGSVKTSALTEGQNRVTKTVTMTVDGKPCQCVVDVTYDIVVNNKVQYYEDNEKTNNKNNPDIQNGAPNGLVTIENEYIRLGVHMGMGGSITLLQSVENGINKCTENIVNSYDMGRQIQMCIYSGPSRYYKPGYSAGVGAWDSLGWNPIQTGDAGNNPSRILAYYNDGECIYVKLRPMQWPKKDMPAECTFEVLYTLIENTVDVKCRIVNNRVDFTDEEYRQIISEYHDSYTTIDDIRNTKQYSGRGETPAIYTNGNFFNLVGYTGTDPFTSDEVTYIDYPATPHGENPDWRHYYCTENWMAFVNNDDYGIGLYNPTTNHFCGGFVGEQGNPGACDEKSYNSGFISGNTPAIYDCNIVYDYEYTLILGTVEQIRNKVYKIAERQRDDFNYDFSEDRDFWTFESVNLINDKGYGNQNCMDLSFKAGGGVLSPQTYWRTQDYNSIQIEAAFESEGKNEFRVDIVLTVLNGSLPADGLADVKITVPVTVKCDGEKRKYSIDLKDIYEYTNSPGCKRLGIKFPACDGNAQIYSVKLVKAEVS